MGGGSKTEVVQDSDNISETNVDVGLELGVQNTIDTKPIGEALAQSAEFQATALVKAAEQQVFGQVFQAQVAAATAAAETEQQEKDRALTDKIFGEVRKWSLVGGAATLGLLGWYIWKKRG
ncbi:MAG: hypothetical protein OXR68_00085 [Alphaproteobacteria bacterium]|nr:hypothetical protein [Alphaproteobacteria bacterium]MDD9919009.1 hypothetical protein [Alphaproteobacteria bacterium]